MSQDETRMACPLDSADFRSYADSCFHGSLGYTPGDLLDVGAYKISDGLFKIPTHKLAFSNVQKRYDS